MSDPAVQPALAQEAAFTPARATLRLPAFLEFLILGATSFGGVVPYLRNSLVVTRQWGEDKKFSVV